MESLPQPGLRAAGRRAVGKGHLRRPQPLRPGLGRGGGHRLLRYWSRSFGEPSGGRRHGDMSNAAGRAPLPAADDIRLAVVGLGYVGLPLALAFSGEVDTLGFDIDARRVVALNRGEDATGELDASERERLAAIRVSDDAAALAERNVFVIAVPTPVDRHKYPDLSALESATRTVGEHLRRGDVVIFESTVYPGATEEVCVPLLEAGSGLRCNADFHVGYS